MQYSQYCSLCYAIDPMSISDPCKTGAAGSLSPERALSISVERALQATPSGTSPEEIDKAKSAGF